MTRIAGPLAALVVLALAAGLSYTIWSGSLDEPLPPPQTGVESAGAAAPAMPGPPPSRASTVAGAEEPANAPESPTVERETIVTGIVIDDDGEPIRGAAITAPGLDGPTARTESADDGTFRLAVRTKPRTPLAVRAEHPGRTPATHADATGRYVVFRLYRGSTVSVRVVTHDGSPVGKARALFFRRGTDDVNFDHPTDDDYVASATTDARGRATVRVMRGAYDVVILRNGRYVSVHRALTAFVDEREVTVEIEPGATIDGRVVNRSGRAVADVRVTAVGAWYERVVTTGPDGAFRLDDVGPGSTRLAFAHPDYAPRDHYVDPAEAVTTGLRIRLDPPLPSLRVRVRYPDGKPAIGHAVKVMELGESRKTDRQGCCTFDHVPRGRLMVVLQDSGTLAAHVHDAREGGSARPEMLIEIKRPPPRDAGLIVDVVGPDGAPLANATVQVTQGPHAAREHALQTTDAAGRARFTNLPADRVEVGVSHPRYPSTGGPAITLTGGQTATCAVTIGTGTINGRVIDPSGRGVRASVMLTGVRAPGQHSICTDRHGYFRFENVGTAAYCVQVDEGPQRIRQLTWPNGRAGDTLEVRVAVPRGDCDGFLRVDVIDASTGLPPTEGRGRVYMDADLWNVDFGEEPPLIGGMNRCIRVRPHCFRSPDVPSVDHDYRIVVDHSGYRRAAVRHRVTRDAKSWRVIVPLERGLTIRGRVVTDATTKKPPLHLAGCPIVVRANHPVDSDERACDAIAEVDARGRFLLTGLTPGKTTLTLSGPFVQPRAMTVDLKESRNAQLIVVQPAAAVRLMLAGSTASRTIKYEFTRLDEPEGGPANHVPAVRLSPRTGGLLIPGLPPGRYACTIETGSETLSREFTAVPGVESRLALP